MKKSLIILFSCLFLNACQSSEPLQSADLQGKWLITAIQGLAQTNSQPYVIFEADTVSGFSGCNHFMGQYNVKDNHVVFDALASTKKLCPPEQMRQEDALFGLLHGSFSSQLSQNTIRLIRNDKTLLQLQKTAL